VRRVCGNPGCSNELPETMRADAKFCNHGCRREAARLSEEGVPAGVDLGAFWRSLASIRRKATVMNAAALRAAHTASDGGPGVIA
jgi:hypothetical protein